MPAPPPESDPAIVSALATPIDGTEYTWRPGAALLSRDHQRELAADAGGHQPLGRAAAGPRTISSNCLVSSRATTISVSPNTSADRLERGEDAVGRLVADDGRLELARGLQPVHAPPRLHRQEAVEDEAVGRHARRPTAR